MAVFTESGQSLIAFRTSDLIGIESHGDNDRITVTQKSGSVSVFDITDEELVKDWNLKGSPVLSSAAVCTGEQYAVSITEKVLRLWDKEHLHAEKGQKIVVEQPVCRLCAVEGQGVLLVYKDGSCAWLEAPNDLLVKPRLPSDASILFSQFAKVADVYVLVFVYKVSGKLMVNFHNVDDRDAAIFSAQYEDNEGIYEEDNQPTDISIACTKTTLELYILWNDNSLTKRSYAPRLPHNSQIKQHHVPLDITPSSAILALDDSQLAIFGVKRQGKVGVAVWDIRFGIIHSWQPLDDSPAQLGQMYRHCGCMVAVGKKGLHVLPFIYKAATLKDSLSKFDVGLQDRTESSDVFSTESAEEFRSAIVDLADREKTRTYKSFKEQFSKVKKELQIQPVETALWEQEANRLALRCASEKAFWPGPEIEQLISARLLQKRSLVAIFPSLVRHKELAMVEKGVRLLHPVPESIVVMVLSMYLSMGDADFSALYSNGVSAADEMEVDGVPQCPFGPKKSRAINDLLQLTFDFVFLVDALRELDFQYVLDLLRYFCYLIQNDAEDASSAQPPLPLLLDWTGLLVDAHYTQIVLCPQTRETLLDLHQAVVSMMQFYEELAPLDGILHELKRGSVKSPKQSVGLYCIETLHVP